MASIFLSIILSLATALHTQIGSVEASLVGICYGMVGDNLPSAAAVVDLYNKKFIESMRLFKPNNDILHAIRDSETGIIVSLGMLDEDIPNIASSVAGASAWFNTNVAPHKDIVEFRYIIVGNEAIPGKFADSITPAMQNLQKVIDSQDLAGTKISTAVALSVLGSSYPPSTGAFTDAAAGPMTSVLNFLSTHKSELLVSVYPYFAYASDPAHISLDYAQFTASRPVVIDGNLSYQNLFDAMVDAVYWASEKVGVSDVNVAVSETGWPSAGNGNLTTAELAGTYIVNFLKHIFNTGGTPKRPTAAIGGYLFEMFNEDLKPTGVDQNFGLFYATGEPVYPVFPINFTNLD